MKSDKHRENELARWLAGDLTNEELQRLRESENIPLLEKIIATTDELDLPHIEPEQMWTAIKAHHDRRKKGRSLRKAYRAVAAAAAIALITVLGLWWWQNTSTTIHVPVGAKQTVTLPDGSLVNLNAESKLTYFPRKWNKKRSLSFEGEGFFAVQPGNDFQVITSQGVISVLGTSFNVLVRGAQFDVSCYAGRVRVNSRESSVELTTGQVARRSGNQPLSVVEFELKDRAYAQWIDGFSTFDQVSIAEVFEELERQYNVTVELSVQLNRKYSGGFAHSNLEEALRSICVPMNLPYQLSGPNRIQITEK